MTRIALVGNLSSDVIAGAPPCPGGAVFHAAKAFARLGSDVAVTASCAARDRADLLPPLEALGLETAWKPSSATTSYAFHYDGDRRVMRQEAVGDPWTPEQAVRAAGDATWVHVGALTRSDFPDKTLAALAAGGRKLLVDAQGLVRTTALGPLRHDAEIGDVLRHITMLKLDEEEAEILAGGLAADALSALRVPEVLVTLGSRGSFVVVGDVVQRVPARALDGPVDPTGAGDTFAAAYLHARTRGASPADAAESASAFVSMLLAERSSD